MSDAVEGIDVSVPPEVESVAQFVSQVEGAAALLTAAHVAEGVSVPAPDISSTWMRSASRGWYSYLVRASVARLRNVLVVLDKHPAHGAGVVAEVAAFAMLSKLTPAGPRLVALMSRDKNRAFKELAKQMELVGQQFEATAALVDDRNDGESASDEAQKATLRFTAVRDALLDQAGGAYSLTGAAKALGVSRQALHKRISSGTALGMMADREIVVPKIQFVRKSGKVSVLTGIDRVTKAFKQAKAGGWSELQFLVDRDPNLAQQPIEALRAGAVDAVERAARAHLHLNEG